MRFVLLFLWLLTSCAHVPVVDKSQDLFWHNLVIEMQEKNLSLTQILERSHPALLAQIKSDSKDVIMQSLWAESINFDSGAKKIIIEDNILNDLHNYFELRCDHRIVHAGVAHTYGYLFSNLETPYGYKRKRWIDPEVNDAFNLVGKSLSPDTKSGTLLSNLTYFAGKIAFKNKNSLLVLEQIKNVSLEIKNFNYSALQVKTLEERIDNPTNIKKIIRTNFVKFPNKNLIGQNEYLLIYSVYDLSHDTENLITAFPINKESYFKTTDSLLMGENRPIMPKYNYHLYMEKDVRPSGLRSLN